jgi:hypothetical protein
MLDAAGDSGMTPDLSTVVAVTGFGPGGQCGLDPSWGADLADDLHQTHLDQTLRQLMRHGDIVDVRGQILPGRIAIDESQQAPLNRTQRHLVRQELATPGRRTFKHRVIL